jgi:hypothetical protein
MSTNMMNSVRDTVRTFTEPEMIDAESAAPKLTPRRRRAFARFGIDKFLNMKLAK